MQNTPPTKFTVPWANSAGTSYIRQIPTTSQSGVTLGAASLQDGFPPLTFVPVSAGGVPPFGQDMNGILNQITAWQRWMQAGGSVSYDTNFQTAIGGYPNNAVILSGALPGVLWRSTTDNNTTNPDAGGAGWVRAFGGRLVWTYTFTSNTVYTSNPGTYLVEVTVVGGGGAGGGGFNTVGSEAYAVGSGGGSGSMVRAQIISGFSNVNITVGSGGIPNAGGVGGNGGTSSFGSILTAPGGGGGQIAAVAVGQTIYSGQGAPASLPSSTVTPIIAIGGESGQCGIILPSGIVSGIGAASPLGGGGGANTNGGSGGPAQAPGAGGGGTATGNNSTPLSAGAGGRGLVIVSEYI